MDSNFILLTASLILLYPTVRLIFTITSHLKTKKEKYIKSQLNMMKSLLSKLPENQRHIDLKSPMAEGYIKSILEADSIEYKTIKVSNKGITTTDYKENKYDVNDYYLIYINGEKLLRQAMSLKTLNYDEVIFFENLAINELKRRCRYKLFSKDTPLVIV